MPPVSLGPLEGIHVAGAGAAFPDARLSNEEVLALLGQGAWGAQRPALSSEERAFVADGAAQTLGVCSRAWAHPVGAPLDPSVEVSVLELSVAAARAALEDAGAAAADLSLIVCATSTPHKMTATVATGVGAALGTSAACMDVKSGCAGGLFGLVTGSLFLQAQPGPVLLVGADTFSKVIPPQSKTAALTLGDGAGALVLSAKKGGRLEAAWLQSDGTLGHLVHTEGALPPTPGDLERQGYVLSGVADALLAVVPEKYVRAINEALARARLHPSDVELFVCHAASPSLLDDVCARTGLSRERALSTMAAHGNIGAASWPVALGQARADGRLRPGAAVLIAAVGGGMSWGAVVLRC